MVRKGKLLLMGGIPVNRPYIYEKPFFKEADLVLQGVLFPLKRKPFKAGKVKIGKTAFDIRNISYPGKAK